MMTDKKKLSPGNPLKLQEARMIRKVFAGLKSVQTLKLVWPYTGTPELCQRIVSRALGKLSLLKNLSLQFETIFEEIP